MIKGKVYKFGDDIDTDVIVPATYLSTFESRILFASQRGRYNGRRQKFRMRLI